MEVSTSTRTADVDESRDVLRRVYETCQRVSTEQDSFCEELPEFSDSCPDRLDRLLTRHPHPVKSGTL